MIVNFLIIKNKEYLTEENSCFVILTNYLNKHFSWYCKFLNKSLFPGLRGHSLKPGRLLNFCPGKRRAQSKGIFIQAGALFSIIMVSKHRAKKGWYSCNLYIARKEDFQSVWQVHNRKSNTIFIMKKVDLDESQLNRQITSNTTIHRNHRPCDWLLLVIL